MKNLFYILIAFSGISLLTSCGEADKKIEITNFNTRSTLNVSANSDKSILVNVKFVDGCAMITSSKQIEALKIHSANGNVEIIDNISKRSGLFCAPDNSGILEVQIKSNGAKYKNPEFVASL